MPHRCAFGCKDTSNVMHSFPNPRKFPERFKAWVDLVGCNWETLTDTDIYKKKRICDIHFTDEHRNRFKRLNGLAIPTLYLPGESCGIAATTQHSAQQFEAFSVGHPSTTTSRLASSASGTEVKKKWANIRDSYRKDLNKVKNTPSGSCGSQGYNIKPYTYAEVVSFLESVFESSHESNYETHDEAENTGSNETGSESSETEPKQTSNKKQKKENIPNQILSYLKTKNSKSESNCEDDDTKYLLSFRSDLKSMTRAQKLRFKIGMLELVKNITEDCASLAYKTTSSSPFSTSPSPNFIPTYSQSPSHNSPYPTTPSPNFTVTRTPSPNHNSDHSPQHHSSQSNVVRTLGSVPIYLQPRTDITDEHIILSIPDEDSQNPASEIFRHQP